MMKHKVLLLLGILCLLIGTAMDAENIKRSDICNPNSYTGGEGIWQIDPADGECWYLHTIAEFDASFDVCYACHDGVQASEW